MSEMSPQMQKAIAAAKAGKTAEAKILLDSVIQDDPENANAWLLKSALSDSPEQQSEYLNKVLTINPEHQIAKSGLAQLGEPVEVESVEVEPVEVESSEAMEEVAALLEEEPALEPVDDLAEQPVDDFDQLFAEEEVDFAAETLRMDPDQTYTADDYQDFSQQGEADSVPAWLAEEGGFQEAAPMDDLNQQEPAGAGVESSEVEELPDWLQEETQADWIPDDQPVEDEVLAPAVEQPDQTLELDEAVDKEPEPLKQPKPVKRARKSPNRIYEVVLGILIILAVLVVAALLFVILSQPL